MAAPSLKTCIEMYLKCENLKNKDLLSKTDAFVKVELRRGHGRWEALGSTEVVKDNLNPVFTHQFKMDYHFEEQQTLRFTAFDYDRTTAQCVLPRCARRARIHANIPPPRARAAT